MSYSDSTAGMQKNHLNLWNKPSEDYCIKKSRGQSRLFFMQ